MRVKGAQQGIHEVQHKQYIIRGIYKMKTIIITPCIIAELFIAWLFALPHIFINTFRGEQ
jgi:hypothetical protein